MEPTRMIRFAIAVATLAFALAAAAESALGQVRVNELLAMNTTGIRDEKGQLEDWLELQNHGTAAVDVSGWYLSDKPDNPTKWAIPASTVIEPGKTLLVWADEDKDDGPYHANFKLDADGESILLHAADGKTQIDRVDFGPQLADVSTGRMVVDPGVWVTFPSPTPRAANRADPFGHLAYDSRRGVPAPVGLSGLGAASVGGTASYRVTGAPALTPGFIVLGAAPAHFDLGAPGVLLVSPLGMAIFGVVTDASGIGALNVPVPSVPQLAGHSVFLQAWVSDGTTGGISGGVVTTIGA